MSDSPILLANVIFARGPLAFHVFHVNLTCQLLCEQNYLLVIIRNPCGSIRMFFL